MKSALISVFGAPDVLVIGDTSLRSTGRNEAVVRIDTAGVNPLDVKIIAGYMQEFFPTEFPYIPGTDFSGIVDSVGAEVTHIQPGDRVVGRTVPRDGGAFAKKLVIEANSLCIIPTEMSFEQAAALPTAFGTASLALFDVGHLKRGQRVLIHAAAGGVGSMAVQLAHDAGAYVVATASAGNIDLVKSLGANEVIDYRTEDFEKLGAIDLVLDTLGGEILETSWSVLRAGGRIASLVAPGIVPRDGKTGEFVFFADATLALQEAVRLFQAGKLQIITDTIFPLSEARYAVEKVATGHARGKVLIRVSH